MTTVQMVIQFYSQRRLTMTNITLEGIAKTVYAAVDKKFNVDVDTLNLECVDRPNGEKHIIEFETVDGSCFRIDIQEA